MEELGTVVERARAGDLDAYREIVRRFQDMAYGYAYAMLGDFHLAQDAAQEAFIQAYRDLRARDHGRSSSAPIRADFFASRAPVCYNGGAAALPASLAGCRCESGTALRSICHEIPGRRGVHSRVAA